MFRKYLCAALFLAVLPQFGEAQASFNFPIPIGSTRVGVAMVNPTNAAAKATYRLYGLDGTLLATAEKDIPARGQLALMDHELFPIINSQSVLGWLQIESADGAQAFVNGGDFQLRMDGSSPAPASVQQIVPLIAGQMRVFGVNPGTSTITVQIQLYDVEGNEVRLPIGLFVQIPPKGALSQELDLTSGLGLLVSSAVYARVTSVSGGPFVGGEIVSGFLVNANQDFAIVTGIDATTQTTELNFPHAVSGQAGAANYTTSIGVINLGTDAQTVTITFTPLSGNPVSVQRSLRAGGAVRQTVQELFNLPPGFQEGWVQVRGTARLTGFVAYADTQAGGLTVSAAQAGATALLFNHIADLPPWGTGIALVNPGNTDANVEVFAMNPDGSLIGGAANVATARFVLPARTKIARVLRELIPATQARTSDGGFVFVRTTNNVPVVGMELFFLQTGAFFANVAAVPLPAGINYTPPQP
jgi:hypothetical protein